MALAWFKNLLRGGSRPPGLAAVAARRETLEAAGRMRTYLLVTAALPSGSTPAGDTAETNPGKAGVGTTAGPSAVLVVLHGSSQSGKAVRSFSGNSFDQLAEGGRVAVVYPNGLKKQWNHNKSTRDSVNDVAFMEALADHFHSVHGPIPVIVAGFSNGGQFAIRLIHEMPGRLYGAAIIGATLPRPGGLAFADRGLPLPVMLVHGTHDLVVPYGGEGWLGSLFGRKRGPSAVETARYFAARNNITAAPRETRLPHRRASGRTSVTATSYGQEGRAPVVLYTVSGGGHVVPNRRRRAIFIAGRTTHDISVAHALEDFFPVLGG